MRVWLGGPRILGIRTGISLGREDFSRFNRTTVTAPVNPIDPDHSFLYVIKGEHGRCKIGLTNNPNARLAQLRTASAFPIDFAWIGSPKGEAVGIERDAHAMLDTYRCNGEWFNIAPDAAVGAICAAAQRRGQAMLGLTSDQAEQIRLICISEANQPKLKWKHRHPYLMFCLAFLTVALWIVLILQVMHVI